MKQLLIIVMLVSFSFNLDAKQKKQLWPDGKEMDSWFTDTTCMDMNSLGSRYVLTDYGVRFDSLLVQTTAIQSVIDRCAREGGGVVVVPRGTFLSGSLFFKQGTHLLVEKGGCLKGSDRIEDFPVIETRIEGETCKYFPALINIDGIDGFVLSGPGTVNGNGHHYWKQFWMRRQWNPACTNKDEQRPRLVYISNSKNITVQNIRLVNSPFWTNHMYKSSRVRYLGCYIYSPTEGLKGPSTDAIDIDACHDVLVSHCYMSVNDDAIAMKGGKGTFADKDPNNGANQNVLIDNCHYGVVHGCLTLGSESIMNHNIILRNIVAENVNRVLWLKMRPDTPQHYEYVKVENIRGKTNSFIVVKPWTQFYHLQDRDDMPKSVCNNIVIKDINMECRNFFDVNTSDKYRLRDFTFINIQVEDQKNAFNPRLITNTIVKNVRINGENISDSFE